MVLLLAINRIDLLCEKPPNFAICMENNDKIIITSHKTGKLRKQQP